jgi:hypothetical protein
MNNCFGRTDRKIPVPEMMLVRDYFFLWAGRQNIAEHCCVAHFSGRSFLDWARCGNCLTKIPSGVVKKIQYPVR